MNGTGTMTDPEGEWTDGKQNGQGTLTYSDGSKYEGEWKEHQDGSFCALPPCGSSGIW